MNFSSGKSAGKFRGWWSDKQSRRRIKRLAKSSKEVDGTGVNPACIPRHVAIIMDGNNRWARRRGLPVMAGYRAGIESIRACVRICGRHEVEALTLFAFSSENWQRPPEEVNDLMTLFLDALQKDIFELRDNNVRLRIIGDTDRFSEEVRREIRVAEESTASNTGLVLSIAASYGGQWDIATAARKIAEGVARGDILPHQVDEAMVARHVCLGDLPMPDLCIRTGGDQRISNFLLWQLAYTELYFTKTFWPDFREMALLEAFSEYSGRQRRFGKTSDQVKGD